MTKPQVEKTRIKYFHLCVQSKNEIIKKKKGQKERKAKTHAQNKTKQVKIPLNKKPQRKTPDRKSTEKEKTSEKRSITFTNKRNTGSSS